MRPRVTIFHHLAHETGNNSENNTLQIDAELNTANINKSETFH